MSAMDIRGLPVINREEKSTEWYRPDFFPTEKTIAMLKDQGYKGMVLFFDELSSAAPAIQAAAYQIILDRATGQYKIPEDPDFPIVMMAAGNNLKDGAVVQNMSSALKNRMSHYFVETDVDGFISWGMNNGLDSRVISYLKFQPDHLHQMPTDPSQYAFPSNRTWEFVSNLIKGKTWSRELGMAVAATIGEGVAHSFASHMKIADQLPDLDEVLEKGTKVSIDTSNTGLVWAFTIGLTSRMIAKGENVKDTNITNFLKALESIGNKRGEFMFMAIDQITNMENKKALPKYLKNADYLGIIKDKVHLITNI